MGSNALLLSTKLPYSARFFLLLEFWDICLFETSLEDLANYMRMGRNSWQFVYICAFSGIQGCDSA